MYSVILVEDDYAQRRILRTMILSIYEYIEIYEADSEVIALDIIKKKNINMFLIDITLKKCSGLNLAGKIRLINKYEFSPLVFLASNLDSILQALKQIHCYDYILKPYDIYDVQAVLSKLIVKEIQNLSNEEAENALVVRMRNGTLVRVKINDILFIVVNVRDCEVNTVYGSYTYSNITLKKILEIINCEYIVQSHKGYAINKKRIFKIEKLDIRLSNVYFKEYSKTALIGQKFKNNIISEFKM